MAATVDYLFGFDATTHQVGDHHYAMVTDAYLLDELAQGLTLAGSGFRTVHRYPERVIKEAVTNQANREIPRLERYLSSLGTIANISTLLGLLGTVTGNIHGISEIARETATLASGILQRTRSISSEGDRLSATVATILRSSRSDAAVFVVTALITVSFDLIYAVAIGVVTGASGRAMGWSSTSSSA